MRAKIVRIGNSQGVRIPRPLLLSSGLGEDVEIEAEGDQIVIRPIGRPREGWSESFQALAQAGEDRLIDRELRGQSSFDQDGWTWSSSGLEFIWWHSTRPVGSEIQKTRPCVVISPDEMNLHIRTVIVTPMTTGGPAYPSRGSCSFPGKSGKIVLDQIRTVDKTRLVRRLGMIGSRTQPRIWDVLQEMFVR